MNSIGISANDDYLRKDLLSSRSQMSFLPIRKTVWQVTFLFFIDLSFFIDFIYF